MKRNKINLHISQNDDGLYFWDRIDPSKLEMCMTILAAILISLPVIVSLTVRLWIYTMKGADGARLCDSSVVNQYWHSLVYFTGALMGACIVFNAAKRYSFRSLSCLREKKWYLSHWLGLNLFFLLVWSVISGFLAQDWNLSLWGDYYCHEGVLLFSFYAFFFLAGTWLQPGHRKFLLELLAVIASVMGVCSIVAVNYTPHILFIKDMESAVFHNRNHYGYFGAVCAPLIIGLTLQDRNTSKILKAGRYMEMWLIFNGLMCSNTRGAFLAVEITLICWNIYIFLMRKDLKRKMIAIDVLFLLTAIFLNFGTLMFLRLETLWQDLIALFSGAGRKKPLDTLGTGRMRLWKYGMQFACEKPLFGYGPGNLEIPYSRTECQYFSPHNDLVLIVASMGFPAVYFYLSGLTAHLRGFFRYVKGMTILDVTMYAVVGSYLISSFVGTSMYYTTPYYFLFLGFSYSVYKHHYAEAQADLLPKSEPESEESI